METYESRMTARRIQYWIFDFMFFLWCHLRRMACGNGALTRTGIKPVSCVFEHEEKMLFGGLLTSLNPGLNFLSWGIHSCCRLLLVPVLRGLSWTFPSSKPLLKQRRHHALAFRCCVCSTCCRKHSKHLLRHPGTALWFQRFLSHFCFPDSRPFHSTSANLTERYCTFILLLLSPKRNEGNAECLRTFN